MTLVLWGSMFPPILSHSFLPSTTHLMPCLRSVAQIHKATCPRTHTFQSLDSTWNLSHFKAPTQPRSAAYLPSPPALESVSSSFNHPGSSAYMHPTHNLLGNQQHWIKEEAQAYCHQLTFVLFCTILVNKQISSHKMHSLGLSLSHVSIYNNTQKIPT